MADIHFDTQPFPRNRPGKGLTPKQKSTRADQPKT